MDGFKVDVRRLQLRCLSTMLVIDSIGFAAFIIGLTNKELLIRDGGLLLISLANPVIVVRFLWRRLKLGKVYGVSPFESG